MAIEVTMPRLSDSMEEGTLLEWLVAEGDVVEQGQPIAEIETDKATMPYEAEVGGVVLKILVPVGEVAAIGAPIALIGTAGEVLAVPPPDGSPGMTSPARPSSENGRKTAARVPASPVARRVAYSLGVDLASVPGSGPTGRVTRADVEAVAAAMAGSATGAAAAPPEFVPSRDSAAAQAVSGAKGQVQTNELSRLQQTVARRMAESRATVPEFELRIDVDMYAAVALRRQLRALDADPLPSYNDMIVKACAVALTEFPRVNGSYAGGRIEQYDRVNVGIAVAADDALVVPVVSDADQMSLGALAKTTRALAAKVRDGSITPPDISGGTFTVSNLGMFGVDSFSAVINVPQAAILAVGAMKDRPIAVDGEIVIRPILTLTLACDHRILYGADGARFLARLRDLLEQPLRIAL